MNTGKIYKIKLTDLQKERYNIKNSEFIPLYSNYLYSKDDFEIIETFSEPSESVTKLKFHLEISNASSDDYLWFTEDQLKYII